MRIGLLSSWASRAGGGVFEALVAHALLLRESGFDPVVFALQDEFSETDRGRFADIQVHVLSVRGPHQIGFAPGLVNALLAAKLDLLHLHGIWMYPSAAASRWAAITMRPYVISPHGMLDPWITSRGRLKKLIATILYEKRSWRRAALFHALNSAEADAIVIATGRTAIEVIPNAIAMATGRRRAFAPGQRFLYLGRIHPKKNLRVLMTAWGRFSTSHPEATLSIAGWGSEELVDEVRRRIASSPAVTFHGPVFGKEKDAILKESDFLVLPSLSEGMPVVVLEALAAGLPVLMSRECNLSEAFKTGAAIDCGTSVIEIGRAFTEAVALSPGEYLRMRAKGLKWVHRHFSPRATVSRWTQTYRSLVAEIREEQLGPEQARTSAKAPS